MVDYTSYSAEELAMDDSFRNWVKQLNQEDVLFWETWAALHPEKAEAVAIAKTLLSVMNTSKQPVPEEEIAEEIRLVKRRMAAAAGIAFIPVPTLTNRYTTSNQWWRAAAVFAALVTAVAVLYLLLWKPFARLEYVTQYGEMQEVKLPDGSKVILSGNSRLRISPGWESSLKGESSKGQSVSRDVWLDGMAYFKVTHLNRSTTNQPVKFIVHAGKVNVEVVGTEFNVSNRGEKVKVLLNSGKVQLNIEDQQRRQQVSMRPGELFEIAKKSHAIKQQEVNTKQYTAWKDGELHLDHTSVTEIAKIIEEAYGYPVVIEPKSLGSREVTGVIQNRNLDFLLKTLGTILSIETSKQDGIVILRATALLE